MTHKIEIVKEIYPKKENVLRKDASDLKIQLAGFYYSSNLGDAVIWECVSWLLQREYPDAQIRLVDLYGGREFPQDGVVPYSAKALRKQQKKLSLVKKCTVHTPIDLEYIRQKRELDRCGAAIRSMIWEEADCCIFAGGQIMMDWLTLEVNTIADAFVSQGKNVYFLAAGTGPLCSPRLRGIYRDLFMNPYVRFISLRDHVDFFNTYFQLPASKKAVAGADCGLWADQVYAETLTELTDAPRWTKNKPSIAPVIGVGFYYPNIVPAKKVVKHMQNLICCLEQHHVSWRAFTNGSGQDAGFGKYILQSIPGMLDAHGAELENIPQKPQDLVRLIASFDGILSFRLHSHIIAASLNVPSVAFVWDDKLNDFFQMMGCPERALPIGAEPEHCLDTLEKAMRQGWNRKLVLEKRQASIEALYNCMCQDVPV